MVLKLVVEETSVVIIALVAMEMTTVLVVTEAVLNMLEVTMI